MMGSSSYARESSSSILLSSRLNGTHHPASGPRCIHCTISRLKTQQLGSLKTSHRLFSWCASAHAQMRLLISCSPCHRGKKTRNTCCATSVAKSSKVGGSWCASCRHNAIQEPEQSHGTATRQEASDICAACVRAAFSIVRHTRHRGACRRLSSTCPRVSSAASKSHAPCFDKYDDARVCVPDANTLGCVWVLT